MLVVIALGSTCFGPNASAQIPRQVTPGVASTSISTVAALGYWHHRLPYDSAIRAVSKAVSPLTSSRQHDDRHRRVFVSDNGEISHSIRLKIVSAK